MTVTVSQTLPEGALVSWYGDDFTGSAAVAEVLTFGGVPAVLFIDLPTPEQLADFAGYRGIGIAGLARSKDPAWMDANLPRIFRALQALGAPIAHYKICSTLDSSPQIGSIGRAVDLAAPMLGGEWHPFVVAAPPLLRHQAFGNLYARFGEETVRLDRHPAMRRHPVTPMGEADVRVHLSRQTKKSVGLVDVLELRSGNGPAALKNARSRGHEIVAIDMIDEGDLACAGALIWESRGHRMLAVGSQGVEYALLAHWREQGLIPATAAVSSAGAVRNIAVVSGSCAPQTAEQIAVAGANGFALVRLDPSHAPDQRAWQSEIETAVAAALGALGEGRDPLVYTAAGPDDPAIARFNEVAEKSSLSFAALNGRVGEGLGRVLDEILRTARLTRGVIAGGDTSGHAIAALGVHALTALAPTVPGAALFTAHGEARRDLQLALKGGQMGTPDYFEWIKRGGGAATRSRAA